MFRKREARYPELLGRQQGGTDRPGVHPDVRDDLACLCQPDQVNGWRVSWRPARPAFQRRLQLSDGRDPRGPAGLEGRAHLGLAAATLDFQPPVATVEALPDCRRRLGRPAEAFHPSDQMCLGAFGLTAASLARWRACSAFNLAARTWLPNIASRDLVLIGQLQRPLHAMPLGFETRNGSARP